MEVGDSTPIPNIPVLRPKGDWQGVQAFCTTRAGGVGVAPYDSLNLGLGAGDDPHVVLANRQRLKRLLPAEPAWLKQVHGIQVVDADDHSLFLSETQPPEADAAVTNRAGRVLAALTADCLSVVITDIDAIVLGVAHAGWKGLAAGVLEATLTKMQHKEPLARQWRAWIGPGIGASAFQVGADVKEAFKKEIAEQPDLCVPDGHVADKWRVDLAGIARLRLLHMGVSQIQMSDCCTVTAITHPSAEREGRATPTAVSHSIPTFFSYRRDRQTGRMATLAWLDQARP